MERERESEGGRGGGGVEGSYLVALPAACLSEGNEESLLALTVRAPEAHVSSVARWFCWFWRFWSLRFYRLLIKQ